jgi:hypothetical protein
MRKILAIALLLACSLQTGPVSAGLYKCVDAKGRTSYQGEPCAGQAEKKSQVEVNTSTRLGPLKGTPVNRRFLALYNAFQIQKVVVDTCVSENSTFADQIAMAQKRYYEHRKENIDRGQAVFERGFTDFSSGQMRSAQREARAEKKIELRGMSRDAFDKLCRDQTDRLQRLVRGDFDKPSGYKQETAGGQQSN